MIVVTDHGHMAQKGFGHGFQSPDETATFVIADGPDFRDGYINPKYAIVDTTPTVVSLFGGTPLSGSDGVPLTTLGGSDVDPVDLKQALEDAIATNDFPPFVTGVSLGLRTIFATIPYYVYMFGNDLGAGLPSVILVPVKILFDGLYVATNVPAQIVALLTGVTGARIFPLLPPAPPVFPPAEDATLPDSALLVCGPGGAPGSAAESWCGAGSAHGLQLSSCQRVIGVVSGRRSGRFRGLSASGVASCHPASCCVPPPLVSGGKLRSPEARGGTCDTRRDTRRPTQTVSRDRRRARPVGRGRW